MPECPASGQSGTWLKRNADVGTSPVPEKVSVSDWDDRCRSADAGGIRLDAGGIRLDADVQLCIIQYIECRYSKFVK